MLTHVQPIEMTLHLSLGPSKTPPISMLSPLPPTDTRGMATKTTTITIYMMASTSHPSISSSVEDPLDIPWHHLRNDGEICKTTSDFTPFPLNHTVESVLPLKDYIFSPFLANDLCLDKGASLFTDSDCRILKKPRNGLHLKTFYAWYNNYEPLIS